MVAPTWLLISSPTSGSPALSNLARHLGSDAMKTGMQLTKPQPASSARSAYHSVAFCEPTGKYDTSTSVRDCVSAEATSAPSSSETSMSSLTYFPMPSSVGPRSTVTPVGATSAKCMVLLGPDQIASATSLPTLA